MFSGVSEWTDRRTKGSMSFLYRVTPPLEVLHGSTTEKLAYLLNLLMHLSDKTILQPGSYGFLIGEVARFTFMSTRTI